MQHVHMRRMDRENDKEIYRYNGSIHSSSENSEERLISYPVGIRK